ARIGQEGLDAAQFLRAKRASFGARLRGLEDFESVCVSLATGLFDGYCALDAVSLLEQIDKAECEAFLREALAPERLSIAILEPRKV
ncbi:MAG: insulinase family protein, partial [Oscillospiraceae bacterium]|nr:insulinase family protein [Oscillospiraceae bacterium]